MAILDFLFSWLFISILCPILIGIGVSVMSMSPPEFLIAKVVFSGSALLLSIKFALWVAADSSKMSLLLSFFIFGAIGGLWSSSVYWVNNRAESPILASAALASDLRVKTETSATAPPTLSNLFNSDFPNILKARDEAILNSKNNNSVTRIRRQVYMDYEAKAQFVGFYIPFLPDDQDFEATMRLVDAVQPALEKLDKTVPVLGDRGGVTNAKDLIFSGRVYLYHEKPFSNVQKAEIVLAYRARGYEVQFRGVDYLAEKSPARRSE